MLHAQLSAQLSHIKGQTTSCIGTECYGLIDSVCFKVLAELSVSIVSGETVSKVHPSKSFQCQKWRGGGGQRPTMFVTFRQSRSLHAAIGQV